MTPEEMRRLAAVVGEHADGAVLRVRVVPRASRTALAGRHADALRVRVAAPPVDDAANDALCAFVADLVDVRAKDVEVLAGQRSRTKSLLVRGVRPVAVVLAIAARMRP